MIDLRMKILEAFFTGGINCEMYETKCKLDALNIAMNFTIQNYSALIIVGGDGTIHEAINGLLRRKDKKKIPVGFLPNGSGDDLVANLGIGVGDIDLALEYICKGDTIKMDVTKVLIDHESESDIAVTVANKEGS